MALSGADREFFALVSRAAFSNPFGREREELDQTIAQTHGEDPKLWPRLLGRLGKRLRRLRLEEHEGEDRALIEHALLFEVFHLFIEPLDALIERQLAAGSRTVEVSFAPDLIGALVERGFARERALRVLTIYYQMRRAFYFLSRDLSGPSASMRRLRERLWENVFSHDTALYERFFWDRMEDFSTILLGETGTGKGTAAAAIGRSGFIPFDEKRRCFTQSFTDTFLSIHLHQFPESLLESELFGHKRGAFTGAVEAHEGVFSRSGPHGSIFLDEIGEVGVPVQIKLLKVLQERVFTPVGSHAEERFEGRVIAATHRSLDRLREEGKLRDDFYYRLCSDVIRVPPLRERIAEEPSALRSLIERILPRMIGGAAAELLPMVEEAIERDLGPAYPWPGNVRELEQCVRRIVLTRRCSADTGALGADGLGAAPGAPDPASAEARILEARILEARILEGMRSESLDARALLGAYCAMLYERHESYEQVARITGLDRRTVKKKVLEAGLEGEEEDEGA